MMIKVVSLIDDFGYKDWISCECDGPLRTFHADCNENRAANTTNKQMQPTNKQTLQPNKQNKQTYVVYL